MKIADVDLESKVLLIAEIGNNHEGDIELAKRMIGLAAKAGADAVKFQTIEPKRLVSESLTERISQLQRFQFTREQFRELYRTATDEGLIFLSTPFDIECIEWLDELVPAYKIASGDNTFYPLLEAVARTAKPVVLSTGLVCQRELCDTVGLFRQSWSNNGVLNPGLALLHCVASYPTPSEEANLRAIQTLKPFADAVGYSDHTLGIDAALISVALGARIVEKHFTIDHDYSSFRDHKLSADPGQFAQLVESIRLTEQLLGDGDLRQQACEQSNSSALRRSIVAAQDLQEGVTLKERDLTWVRPAGGLAPGREKEIIGKTLRRNILAGQQILLEDVQSIALD